MWAGETAWDDCHRPRYSSRPLRRDHEVDGLGVARPLRKLGGELAPAGGGELVELRLAISLRVSPLCSEPSLLLHAMERGVERAFGDLQALSGDLLNPAEHGEAVHGTPAQGLEDEEVEGAAKEVEIRIGHGGPEAEPRTARALRHP